MTKSTGTPVRAEPARPAAIKGSKATPKPKGRRATDDVPIDIAPSTAKAIDKAAARTTAMRPFGAGVELVRSIVAKVRDLPLFDGDEPHNDLCTRLNEAEFEIYEALDGVFGVSARGQLQDGFVSGLAAALWECATGPVNWNPWVQLEAATIARPEHSGLPALSAAIGDTRTDVEADQEFAEDDLYRPAEIRRGAERFVSLINDIRKLPPVSDGRLVSKKELNLAAAEQLILRQFDEGFDLDMNSDRSKGFVRSLAMFLLYTFNGYEVESIGTRGDEDVDYLLYEQPGTTEQALVALAGVPSLACINFALDWIREHREQAWALAVTIQGNLTSMGEDAAVRDQRLADVLVDLLGDAKVEADIRALLLGSDTAEG